MHKSDLMALLCLFLSLNLQAQSEYLSVVASAGGSYQTSDMVLDWTLGESFIETIQLDDMVLTQGFHQPLLTVKKVNLFEEDLTSDANDIINVTVYPNPVKSVLDIKLSSVIKVTDLEIYLTDNNGRRVQAIKSDSPNTSHQINMGPFAAGVYYLHCSSKEGEWSCTYQIIKSN